MHYSRGQGATEYLVVLGAVLLVSMVVVQAVASSSSSGIELREQQSESYWKKASPFSITSYTLENGLLAATIRNQLTEPLKLTSVRVVDSAGASTLWSGSAIVSGGAETTLFMRYGLNNSCKNSAGGTPFEITQITFNYDKTSIQGLKQVGDKSLAGKCAAQQGIVFRSPTPSDGASVSSNTNVSINATIDGSTAIRLKDFGLVWNGTNTSFYDDSLVLAMNFDDVYELGERGGKVVDVSSYGNNGVIYGNTAGIWHFDEADGSRVADESRFGNNGTIYGNTRLLLHLDEENGAVVVDSSGYDASCVMAANNTRTTGKTGGAVRFYGDHASRITCTNTSAFNITNNMTITAWVKLANNLNSAIMGRESGGPRAFTFRKGISNGVCFEWSQNNTIEGSVYNTCTTAGIDDNWHHGAVSFASGQYKIYVDDQLNVSGTSAITSIYTGTNPNITIGYSVWSSDYDANGTIDEVGLYSTVLNATQIAQQYNEGRAKHADWADGKSGSGLSFDGANDYVSVGNSASLNLTDRITIEMWVKPNSLSNDPVVLSKDISSSYYIQLLSTGSIQFGIDYAGGAGRWLSSWSNVVGTNNWYHVVGTYDKNGGSNNLKIYSNGALVGQGTYTGSAAGNSAELLFSYPYSVNSFNGSIDEVGIYNRSFSASDVLARYNAGRAKHADWNASGKNGPAMLFDGVNGNNITIPNSASVENVLEDQFTLSAWFKPAATPPDYLQSYAILIRTGSHSGLMMDNNNKANAWLYNNSGLVTNFVSTNNASVGQWNFAAMTYNNTSKQINLYLNGVKTGPHTLLGQPLDYGTNTFKIGKAMDGSCTAGWRWCFNGSIDEVRVWKRALSDAEIRQQYYSSLNKFAPDKWVFNSTQTLVPAGTHTYYLYANGTDGSSDFTEERTIRAS